MNEIRKLDKRNKRLIGQKTLGLLVIFLSLSMTAFSPKPVHAISNNGITLSPVFRQVTISSSEAQETINYSITNNEPVDLSLGLSTINLSDLNTSGGVLFAGNSSLLSSRYNLTNWISLNQKTLLLEPHQTGSFSVNINNAPSLAAGGHYGGVLVHVLGSNSFAASQVNNQISLNSEATSLIFLTKIGGDTYNLSLQKVSFSNDHFSVPNNFLLKFYDSGNSQVTPRGYITVTTSSGKLIKKGIINEDSDIVLPGTTRYFPVSLYKVSGAGGLGSYKIHVYYRLDGDNSYRQYLASLFIISLKFIVEVIIILGIVIASVVFFIKRDKRPKNKPKSKPKKPENPKKTFEVVRPNKH